MALIYIGLGSNLGNREQHLNDAIRFLKEEVGSLQVCSSYYESKPWGFDSPNWFLNACAAIETTRSPEECLRCFKQIESKMGRKKQPDHEYRDRIIDLDLLFYDALIMTTPELTLPHPSLEFRSFVLIPLLEIAPDLRHPVLKKTPGELLQCISE